MWGELGTNLSILVAVGVLLLVTGKVFAAFQLWNLRKFLILTGLAEIGLVLIGFGLGDLNGVTGASFHLIYQLVVRILIYAVVIKLISSDTHNKKNLQGMIYTEPFLVTILGFGLFSAIGFSVFKASTSKLLIIYSALGRESYILALLIVLASLIEAACFLKIFHSAISKEGVGTTASEARTNVKASGFYKSLVTGLSFVSILLTMFQEVVMEFLSKDLLGILYNFPGQSIAQMESPWPLMVLVPYIGAFVVYLIGRVASGLRNLLAIGLSFGSLVLVTQTSNLDGLSHLFALLMTFICLLVVIYSTGYFNGKSFTNRYFFFLMILQASLVGITTTDHLGNFYAFWEIMTWSSYFLVIQEQTKEALKAGYKYFMMCVAGAFAILFAKLSFKVQLGTNDLGTIMSEVGQIPEYLVGALALGLIIGFAVKIGLVPVHSWLPAAHPVAPSPISAPMSGILTKIGIFGVLKVVFLVFGVGVLTSSGLPGGLQLGSLLAFLGAITLLYGDIKALKQTDVKKMLAFSTMAQVGEIVIALSVVNYISMVGGLSHVVNHAIMKNLLFLAIGAMILKAKGQELKDLKGIGRQMPITALCFSIGVLGIMALPPFSGFISKFLILYGLIQGDQWLYAGVILLGSFIGCFYYLRIIKTIYFEKYTGPKVSEVPLAMLIPSVGLAVLVIFNGVLPQYALTLVKAAVDTLAIGSSMVITTIPDITISWPLPVMVTMAGAFLAFILGKKNPGIGGWVGVVTLALATVSLILSYGNYNIGSAIFALLIALVGLLNLLYSVSYMDHSHTQHRFYFFFLLMIGGLMGVALSKDLFSFFAFWEIMSSWALYFTIIHEETRDSLKEGFKYFIFNYAGANFMLFGLLVLTVLTGTFEFSLIAERAQVIPLKILALALILMTLGFLMKAAMLPWRIDYQMHPKTAPTPVSGYISAVLLKSAPFGLAKVLFATMGMTLVAKMSQEIFGVELWRVIAWISGISILWAGVKAFVQTDMKKVLIYSTVSQMGYIILGISLGSPLGVAGGIYHLVNHMFFKNLLFLGAGAIMYRTGAKSLKDVGGLAKKMPITATFFVIGGLASAGIPPLNGFFSKWLIYKAALERGEIVLALIAILASVVTLAYFMKFLHAAFFGQLLDKFSQVKEAPMTMLVPMGVLAALCVVFGVVPGLPLSFIAQIQGSIGIDPFPANLTGLFSFDQGWAVGVLIILMVVTSLISWVLFSTYSRKVRYTEVYTCGIVDLSPQEIHVSGEHLYEGPVELVKDCSLSFKKQFKKEGVEENASRNLDA